MKAMRVLGCLLAVLWGCEKSVKPKPQGYLALNFPPKQYKTIANCAYKFKVNQTVQLARPFKDNPCLLNLKYSNMRGTIYITYEEVNHNLEDLIKDAEKLPLKHTIKADEITGNAYENAENKTYGMLYSVTGDAASQAQFFLTDSSNHFMTGSVYFERQPNYDSIYPAAEYLKTDLIKLIESLEWIN